LAGIYVDRSYRNEIYFNYLQDNGNGILLSSSSSNNLTSNLAEAGTYGISLMEAPSNVMTNNTMRSNSYNFRVDAGEVSKALKCSMDPIDFVQEIRPSPIPWMEGPTGRWVHRSDQLQKGLGL
jgi:parallel beta-helix repeat protein